MPETTEIASLTADEFRQELLAAVECVKAEDTRFYRLLMTGRCPRAMLEQFARATVQSADLFCGILADMVEMAPDGEARLVLLENLLEEEGLFLRPAVGIVSRPQTSHPALARRFALSLGIEPEPNHETMTATAAGQAILARGDWVEAVAHLLLGQELHFAEAAPAIARGLMRNGLTARDVAFFSVHEVADRKHGEQALELVIKHARGREQQERCIIEARAGAQAWMSAHGGLVR